MDVPEQFLQNMRSLLGDGFHDYSASFSMQSFHGLRINTLRKNATQVIGTLPFVLDKVPYVQNAFYTDPDQKASRHPYYAAGLFYLQEPSAMLPADRLPIDEGDLVLDLCAAPGGKATALAAKLNGSGILLANDISVSRASALLKNLELSGATNSFVSAESPQKLADTYGPVFDKILVDAPCSGEGMFRKDPALIKDWLAKGPGHYVPIQREILSSAYALLKPGGMLLYSTCTFSEKEDEEQIRWLMEQYPDLVTVPLETSDGLESSMEGTLRAYPHKIRGEGHFLALLQKDASVQKPVSLTVFKTGSKNKLPDQLLTFINRIRKPVNRELIYLRDEKAYLMPAGYERIYKTGIRFIRTGVLLGECRKNAFKPDQAVALTLDKDDYAYTMDLQPDDENISRYLRGETLQTGSPDVPAGAEVLVTVNGYALGFAKKNNEMLKNLLKPSFRQTF